jgi:hypothetical protein
MGAVLEPPFSVEARRAYASWLGARSYQARLRRLGIERLREIARENGKKGGRPPKSKEI